MENDTLQQKIVQRWGALKTQRSSWMTHWQDLTDHILPRNGRYFQKWTSESGRHLYNRIYDNTGTHALRVLGAGLMAGATNPTRPWFRLIASDPDLNDFHPVREWLDHVVRRMQHVFQRSNTYRTLHGMYEEIGTFGTSVSLVLEDRSNTIHHYPVPLGEFALAHDYQGRVNTLYREFQRSVVDCVREFGLERVSERTRTLYRNGTLEAPVTIIHAIEPRGDRDPSYLDNLNMAWRSVYIETGQEEGKILRESGFRRFPVLAPRWAVNTGDVYGHSPGMQALQDIRGLQHLQLRKAQAIDYQTKPPIQAPTELMHQDRELLPGGVHWYDPGGVAFVNQSTAHGGVRSAWEVRLDINGLLLDIDQHQGRINRSFFADLFLLLSQRPANDRMTATEVAERHEEKLLMLGPTLERLHNELLQPLIDITFDHMLENGALPPPPPDLEGQDLTVEFVSILAQAQRAVGLAAVDRWLATVGGVAQFKPEILDKVNVDEVADGYAMDLGVPPHMVLSDDKVGELREARNRAAAAQQQIESMQGMAKGARDLAQAPTDTSNVLSDIVGAGL